MRSRVLAAVATLCLLVTPTARAAVPPGASIGQLSQWMTIIQVQALLGTPDIVRKVQCAIDDGIIVPCLVWDYIDPHADYRVMFDMSMPVAALFKFRYVYGGNGQ